jgi:GPH family glycoside/pentoside/hexuronide:cation symporter
MSSTQKQSSIRAEESARASLRAQELSFGTRVTYSIGAFPDAVTNTSVNIFLLFYVTTACGLSAGMAGTAIALGLIFEAVADPLIGLFSDNLRSRWGRRLPFMIGGLPLLLISYILLFSLPDTSDQWLLFALVAVLSATVRTTLSLYNLPYFAAGAEMSDEPKERERIIAWRWTMAVVGAFLTVAVGMGLYFKGNSGIAQRLNYVPYAWTMAGIMLVGAGLAIWAVWRTRGRQHAIEVHAVSASALAGELRELLRSRSFRILFGVAFMFAAAQGVTQTLGLHAYAFFWHLPAEQAQGITLAIAVGLMLGAPIAGPIVLRLEYRVSAMIGLGGMIVMQAVPAALKLAGLLTLEGDPLARVLTGFAVFGGAMTTVAAIAVLTMITNAADEHEYIFGVRREGSYFAGWTLALKAAGAFGTLLSGLALQAIDFPVQLTKEQGLGVTLPQQMTDSLGLFYGPGAAILSLVALGLLSMFHLSREGHRKIMIELEARRAAALA